MSGSRSEPDLRVYPTPEEAAAAAAAEFLRRAHASIRKGGRFTVALSGGSTPRLLYEKLAQVGPADALIWPVTQVFLGDERWVMPDSTESNYRMARESLLSRVPVPEKNIHRIRTERGTPAEAARAYEAEIRRVFVLKGKALPRFDLILLGLGPDGHTASLFPGTSALSVEDRLVIENRIGPSGPDPDGEEGRDGSGRARAPDGETPVRWRITLTLPVLDAAACVVFLAWGKGKEPALERALEKGGAPPPAGLVRPANGETIWIVDQAAAGDRF